MPMVGHNRGVDTPSQEAQKVSASWRDSVSALLDACERICRALNTFDQNESKLTKFIVGLVKGKVLTEREGKLGAGSPKLSKLRTIGQHVEILKRKSIASNLTPDYTVLYQLCVLYKRIPSADLRKKAEKLENIISSCSGELSRDYLASATKRVRRQKSPKKPGDNAESSAALSRLPTLAELISRERLFDLLLITPTKSDIALLASDYEANAIEKYLPLFKLIDHASPTGLIVIAAISDLPTIATKLLPLAGFSHADHVILAHKPTSADITDATVGLVAEKGMKLKPKFPTSGIWLDIKKQGDATKLAEDTFPLLKERLHIFAEHPSPGWASLVGDRSWIELPSFR